MSKHEMSLVFNMQKYGLNHNDVWVLFVSHKSQLPQSLCDLPYNIDHDVLSIFHDLARNRLRIKYDENQEWQEQVNDLFDMKDQFFEWNPFIIETTNKKSSPIKRIEIELKNDSIVMSNKLLLDNFYLFLNARLREFLTDYVEKNYRPIKRVKGMEKGLQPANKNLAKKILKYLEVEHPALRDKERADIITTLFRAAGNPLRHKNDVDFLKKLKKSIGAEKIKK